MNATVSRIDRLGSGVSFLCAIHCAIMPFVVAHLPLAGSAFLADERLEWSIVGVSIILAGMSVWRGIRIHQERRVLILFGRSWRTGPSPWDMWFEQVSDEGPKEVCT
jgi:hypothetical protein